MARSVEILSPLLVIIGNEQVKMVACDHVGQNRQPVPLPSLIQPLQIPMPIL